MAERRTGRLVGVMASFWAACLAASGCQGQLMWVPPGSRVSMANGAGGTPVAQFQPAQQAAAQPPVIQQAGYQGRGVIQTGCATCPPGNGMAMGGPVGMTGPGPNSGVPLPTELQKVSMPPYMVEPPDILLIDAIRFVPKPPYRIEPLDQLIVQATETFPNQPIAGVFVVSPDGFVSLGFNYGSVRVAGLTLEQAEAAIRGQLGKLLKSPGASVGLAQFRGLQQVRGEHLVRPDGTLSLGTYGCVHVAGLTLSQIKTVIEKHLSLYLQDPEVAVDVFAYNSKAFYVITDGAGYGQQVFKFPVTGNETVLDAIERIGGIPPVGSKRQIWVARPAPCGHPCDQILPVDWLAITQGGATCTNYQLFPGDRIYVKSDPLIHLDYTLAKIISPIERVFGIILLGSTTVQSLSGNQGGIGNGGFIVSGF